MKKTKIFFLFFILWVFYSENLYSFSFKLFPKSKKEPIIKLVVLNESDKSLITNYTYTLDKISEKEKKGESFIYRLTITADNFNPYSKSFDVPYSYKGKKYVITNYLTPLILKEKERFINLSGYVFYNNNIPLYNAFIKCIKNNNEIKKFTTKSNGFYAFTNLEFTNYRIEVVSLAITNLKPQMKVITTNDILNTITDEKAIIFDYKLDFNLKFLEKKKFVKSKIIKKEKLKRKKKKKLTPYQIFFKTKYYVKPYTVVKVKNKKFFMNMKDKIVVGEGAVLILDNVKIKSKKNNKKWSGIYLKKNSSLIIKNSYLFNAECAIKTHSAKKIILKNSSFTKNDIVLNIQSSLLKINKCIFRNNNNPIKIYYSQIYFSGIKVIHNESNVRIYNSNIDIDSSFFGNNKYSFYLKDTKGNIFASSFFYNKEDGVLLENSSIKLKYCNIYKNTKNGINSIFSNPLIEYSNIYDNKYYAVKDGGSVISCYIAYNNFSDKIDNSPDNGKRDWKFFSNSNTFIKQLFQVDSIKNLRLKKLKFKGGKN